MMITQRDKNIIDLIELTGAAKTSHIYRLFMKYNKQGINIAQRRLKRLYNLNMLQRTRAFINTEYIYYKRKTQLEHKLTLTEFYVSLMEFSGKVLKFESEKQMGDIRPDAICDYLYDNNVYQMLIEIHLSTISFNQQKYENFYESGQYRQWYKIFPRIVIISDRKINIKPSRLKYIQIPTNCQGIAKILK